MQKKYKKQEIINKVFDFLEWTKNNNRSGFLEFLDIYFNDVCLASDGFFLKII